LWVYGYRIGPIKITYPIIGSPLPYSAGIKFENEDIIITREVMLLILTPSFSNSIPVEKGYGLLITGEVVMIMPIL